MSARGALRSGVFVAGTDTGIGKTFFSCALLHALRNAGLRATGMKPVASGCAITGSGLRNEDALALIAASDPPPDHYALCNPYAFEPAIAPHLAAADAHVQIELSKIEAAYTRLAARVDVVVVEGVGGWAVPLSDTLDAEAIPRALNVPVLLVVGLRLGCLNHARLSARTILDDGCELLGWVGNHADPAMERSDENLEALRRLLPAPCLGVLPHGISPAEAASGGALRDVMSAIRSRP
ncbi:MAG TPA: dethiobiotin synthase [Rhodanobacteraceae bacterium]|nr:dethiobiotin synthase [Rhodanobacteraceae bacterium]